MLIFYGGVSVGDFFNSVFQNAMKLISSMRLNDAFDIVVVTLMLYFVIKLFRQTRAIHLVKGLVLLGVIYFIVSALDLSTSSYLFSLFFRDIVIILVLLFQNEIRHAIEVFGRGDFKRFSLFSSKNSDATIEELRAAAGYVSKAVSNMSEKRVGALIVFEGKSPLGEIVSTGTSVDSSITVPMIENIFYPKAPLHDGAMVIIDNRIHSAGCILPLTQNELSRDLGTRHRAAVGISEVSDALVVVVSEETGKVSVAYKSVLERDVSQGELLEKISAFLISDNGERMSPIARRRKNRNEE